MEATRCLFRTRSSPPRDAVEFNEVFGMQISHSALRQKTLRVDVCDTGKSGHEECLVSFSSYVTVKKKKKIMFTNHRGSHGLFVKGHQLLINQLLTRFLSHTV